LEDETPPISFYLVLEIEENAVRCMQCEKLLVSVNAESLQWTIGNQTQMLQLIQAQTQTEIQKKQIGTQIAIATIGSQTDRASSLTMLEDLGSPRSRSFWSVFKKLLLCISLLNGFYLLCHGICRLAILSHGLLDVQTAPSTSILSVITRVPVFVWSQLCRLARKLHIN